MQLVASVCRMKVVMATIICVHHWITSNITIDNNIFHCIKLQVSLKRTVDDQLTELGTRKDRLILDLNLGPPAP